LTASLTRARDIRRAFLDSWRHVASC
jgi:hypothetical protein